MEDIIVRMKAENRYKQMLDRAVDLFRRGGLDAVHTKSVGAACGVSHSLVLYYFGSADELRRRVEIIANGGTP
jgi:AcrR family transcriptional regulator